LKQRIGMPERGLRTHGHPASEDWYRACQQALLIGRIALIWRQEKPGLCISEESGIGSRSCKYRPASRLKPLTQPRYSIIDASAQPVSNLTH
jgi:hypothetical protein